MPQICHIKQCQRENLRVVLRAMGVVLNCLNAILVMLHYALFASLTAIFHLSTELCFVA